MSSVGRCSKSERRGTDRADSVDGRYDGCDISREQGALYYYVELAM